MPLPVWTNDQVIGQLRTKYIWGNPVITYSFATSGVQMSGTAGQLGFTALSAAARDKAALAFSLWDDLIARGIAEAPAGTSSRSTDVELALSTSLNVYAGTARPAASIWFNGNYTGGNSGLTAPIIGCNGFLTYVHEIGHALGLDHMGAYNGSVSNPSCFQDSWVYSVMSYFGPPTGKGGLDVAQADWVAGNNVRYYAQTPMLNDVLAMQTIYGADTTTRTGDTVYGFNSNVTDLSKAVFDFKLNAHPVLCIYDAAGIDTLDLSGFAAPSVINLAPGSFSDCDSMTMNISIAYSAAIENAVGGAGADQITGNGLANTLTGNGGNDTLRGGTGDDQLIGGAGNDTLIGGAGQDTAMFAANWSAISAAPGANGAVVITSAADGTDTVSGVEFFLDGAGVRKSLGELVPAFSVTDTAPVAEGNEGTTDVTFTVSLSKASPSAQSVDWAVVFGSGDGQADAADFAGPTSGTVQIDAGATSATITLSVAGDAVFEPDDAFTLVLSNPALGAVLDVASARGSILNDDLDLRDVDGGGQMFAIFGDEKANTLDGDFAPNRIMGYGGDDTLSGAGGDDVLNGGAGQDRLTGGAGADVFKYGALHQASARSGNGFNPDVITDFETGVDKIDLHRAAEAAGVTLRWNGTGPITTAAQGEIRIQSFDDPGSANDYTMVFVDTDSDRAPEFAIKCLGLVGFNAGDFIL